jgi:hypothetical protein
VQAPTSAATPPCPTSSSVAFAQSAQVQGA